MDRYILTRPVTVTGYAFPSFLFRKRAEVTLVPVETGWFWNSVPITQKLLRLQTRSIALVHGNDTLNIVEHLLALRMSGLDGVDIRCNGELPYDGCAKLFWNNVLGSRVRDGSLRLYRPKKTVSDALISNIEFPRYVTFTPGESETLEFRIHIDYPGLGPYDHPPWTLDSGSFADIIDAKSPGLPPALRPLVRIAGGLLRWPHREAFTWQQEGSRWETHVLFAQHRILDICGALGGITPQGGMLAGVITSWCGGHAYDLGVNRAVEDSGGLVPVN
jgi:UDP-3-O-acyl-N-acetylglucosamine deacetylase